MDDFYWWANTKQKLFKKHVPYHRLIEFSLGKAFVTRLLLDPTYHDRVNFQLFPPTIFGGSRIYFSPAKAP